MCHVNHGIIKRHSNHDIIKRHSNHGIINVIKITPLYLNKHDLVNYVDPVIMLPCTEAPPL